VGVLVGVDELAERLSSGDRLVLLDVRWTLPQPDGRPLHAAGHIPGAVYVDLDHELAAPPSPTGGRHPLPAIETLQAAARRWGVRRGDVVIAYDDVGGLSAARAWWLLRWGGHREVRLLDGGLAAWIAAGRPLETGTVEPEAGDVTLTGGAMPVVDADGAARLAARGVLLDARAGERYRGEVEPVDPRAGHVPGAISAPTTENLTGEGHVRPPADLRARFDDLGVDGSAPVAVYCGSGVTAAHEVAALALVGVEAALYPGSWSQWSADPDRPVATGPTP
jgi:thiosulfate/3-mercaptopyruvate sulfurtransferase